MGSGGQPALESLSVHPSVQGGDSAAKGAHPRRLHSVNEYGEIPNAPGRTLVVDSTKFAYYERLEGKRWVQRGAARPPAARRTLSSGYPKPRP